MTRTELHDCEQTVLGEDVCIPATVVYEYDKGQKASRDIYGFEPHINPSVTLCSITVNGVDVLPWYPAKAKARMESDLLRAVEAQEEFS